MGRDRSGMEVEMDKKELGSEEKHLLLKQLTKWAVSVLALCVLYCTFGNVGILFALALIYIIFKYA